MESQIKLLLVEDHNIVRYGIKSLLEAEPGFKVVAEATNGREALEQIKQGLDVDIVLTDINMPELAGIELIEILQKEYPAYKCLILSMLDHQNYVYRAMEAGAMGYLVKNIDRSEMIFAIRQIYAGHKFICTEIALKLISRHATVSSNVEIKEKSNLEFSKRELEILQLIAEGMTNNDIALKLFTSRRTIEGNRQSLLEKTNTKNTASLIHFVIKHGIIG